ncbi:WD40 repeat-like protein [Exidia glandulosa HHB12029]|uniref:WD40 repeat-like protein n=1 Tax=Exidia glandulosa HHB12029 TaxID=1314781 RepID=A0A165NN85_EXIGL|nr:WD40 repeat-like protein [Exidia glandulosa HHB12029]
MRVKTLEIRWHDGKPITTCDFQPQRSKGKDTAYRLATGGEDNNVRIWMVHPNLAATEDGQPTHPPRVEYLSTLSKHSASVNVVRFSPSDGMIIIWSPTDRVQPVFGGGEASEEAQYAKEHWRARTSFRCTTAEVYDLAWCPTGEYIVAGSTDNAARIFSASDGSCVRELAEHAHYVQGVAWDPLNEFMATQSSDRAVHIYSVQSKHGHLETHAVSRNARMQIRHARTPSRSRSNASDVEDDVQDMPPPRSRRSSFSGSQTGAPSPRASPAPPLPAIRPWVKLYGDESHTNFYRRLTFSPDGALLLTPAGHVEDTAVVPGSSRQSPVDGAGTSSVFVYTRSNFTRPPVAQLPGFKKATIAVRFSPILYDLRPRSKDQDQVQVKTETKEVHIGKETDMSMDIDLVGASSAPTPAKSVAPLPSPAESPAQTPIPLPAPTASSGAVFALPYRMLYSVASMDSVAIYDTQQASPIALLSRLHYDEFTDMSWSPDGRALILSARDGYCTVVVFDEKIPVHHTQQQALQLQSLAAHTFGTATGGAMAMVSPPVSIVAPSPGPEARGVKRPASPVGPTSASGDIAPLPADASAPPPTKKRRAALTHHGQDAS